MRSLKPLVGANPLASLLPRGDASRSERQGRSPLHPELEMSNIQHNLDDCQSMPYEDLRLDISKT
ncbi:MAG: hypothetical protein PUP93_15520 [Rhizonema sp. NSF051]|nr:hypothetical protein [Rhizonema sp. NSF051]